jgi:hypothetical protein
VDVTPSPAEIKTAQELARQAVLNQALSAGQKLDLQSPDFLRAVEEQTRNILAQSGKIYTPSSISMGATTQNRGSFAQIMGQ